MGLRQYDLKDMIYEIITIDDYTSKMGDDKNIVTISFQVASKEAADDLCDFLEKGYQYILDADVSSGEIDNNEYLVFLELKRERLVHKEILEILEDVKKVSGIEEFKFRYYKQFRSHVVNMSNLKKYVPSDPDDYGIKIKSTTDNYMHFFKDSPVESIGMTGDYLIFENSNLNKVIFEIVDYGSPENIKPLLVEQFQIMESYPEINYLTKYLGNYNISKYGNIITMENQANVLAVRRIK
ncbi:MAG: hypothetical protein ACOCP4_01750 [Candidatus Woesearchaeota archaeon]